MTHTRRIDRTNGHRRRRRAPRPSGVAKATGRLLLSELARREGVAPSTVWRWCQRGAVGLDGIRRRLPCIRIGGRWAIEDAAFVDWTRRLAEPAPTETGYPALERVRGMSAEELHAESGRALGLREGRRG